MPYIVQQRREPDHGNRPALLVRQPVQISFAREDVYRTPGKVVNAQGVKETRVHRPRVNEVSETKLLDPPESLEFRRIDDRGSVRLEMDVLPDWISDGARTSRVPSLQIDLLTS